MGVIATEGQVSPLVCMERDVADHQAHPNAPVVQMRLSIPIHANTRHSESACGTKKKHRVRGREFIARLLREEEAVVAMSNPEMGAALASPKSTRPAGALVVEGLMEEAVPGRAMGAQGSPTTPRAPASLSGEDGAPTLWTLSGHNVYEGLWCESLDAR